MLALVRSRVLQQNGANECVHWQGAHCTNISLLLAAYILIEKKFLPEAACAPFMSSGACSLLPFTDCINHNQAFPTSTRVKDISLKHCIQAFAQAALVLTHPNPITPFPRRGNFH
jgi:hypothetical protein